MSVKTNYIFVFFGIYTHSGFHSVAIITGTVYHMITSCVFFLSFWDFSVSISISDAILY